MYSLRARARGWGRVAGFCMLLILPMITTVADAAGAQSKLPSTQLPAKGKWQKMRPSSFPATAESAFDQCLRTVGHYHKQLEAGFPGHTKEAVAVYQKIEPLMVEQTCFTYRDKLEHPENYPVDEQCYWDLVPDDIVFLYMNGLIGGHRGVTELVQKDLGREDKALICLLGDGLTMYWFRNDPGRSCNNVGPVYDPPPEVVETEPECRVVPISEAINDDLSQQLDSQALGCCCTDDQHISNFNFHVENTLKMPQRPTVVCD